MKDLAHFLNKIFLYYPPKINEKLSIQDIIKDYFAIIGDDCYNYELAFKDFMRNYTEKTTPKPAVLLKTLERYKVVATEVGKEDEKFIFTKNLKAIAPNGIEYDFAYGGNSGLGGYFMTKNALENRGFKIIT